MEACSLPTHYCPAAAELEIPESADQESLSLRLRYSSVQRLCDVSCLRKRNDTRVRGLSREMEWFCSAQRGRAASNVSDVAEKLRLNCICCAMLLRERCRSAWGHISQLCCCKLRHFVIS